MAQPWSQRDSLLCVALAAATFVTRATLRVHTAVTVDAGLLVLGIDEFDFANYQPHPPYYPLTIVVGHLFSPFVGASQALVWAAVFAGTGMVTVTYAIARRLAGQTTAALAAFAVFASPVALSNSTVGLSYALEGFAVSAVALLALDCRRRPDARRGTALGLAAAMALGLRPSALLVVGPLVLWGGLRAVRSAAATMGAGMAGVAAWLAPTIHFGGGWTDFEYGNAYHARVYYFADTIATNGWSAAANHAAWLAWQLRREGLFLLSAAFLSALLLAVRWSAARGELARREALGLIAAWLAPAFAFYVFVYAGWPVYPDGYLMGVLPGLAIGAALAVAAAVRLAGSPAALPLRVVLVISALVVVVLPVGWFAQWDDAMVPARASDAWTSGLAGLGAAFAANDTALLASYSTPWVQHALPEHLAWFVVPYVDADGLFRIQIQETRHGRPEQSKFDAVRDGPVDPPHSVPPWVSRIVVVEGHPLDGAPTLLRPHANATWVRLPSGGDVQVIDAAGLATIEEILAWSDHLPAPFPNRTDAPW